MNLLEKLSAIQVELNAPKNQFNKFGNYAYRSCEDILAGVKPLLKKYKVALIVADEVVQIGERFYVRAEASLIDTESESIIKTAAFAREEESKKGMDGSQLTGSTSSYARKYALNGLLAIDDNKDSDSLNHHGKDGENDQKTPNRTYPVITEAQQKKLFALAKGNNELVKKIIGNYGYTSTSTIRKDEYESISKDIENIANYTGTK